MTVFAPGEKRLDYRVITVTTHTRVISIEGHYVARCEKCGGDLEKKIAR